MLVELTVRALASAGYQATGATDLASLDQKLTEGPFALILMDVNMPEMFGDDVVEYLRTQKKVTSKLVLYSDISEEELAAKTRNSGADAYILKGGGLEAVIGGIMRIMGAPTGSAAAPARAVTNPGAPAARPTGTAAAPRPPSVAPATRPPAPAGAPRPVAPGTPQANVAAPPRVAPAPMTQAQAIPGPRAPVAGQAAPPRPVAQAPAAGAHPTAAAHPAPGTAPRAPVAGQVAASRPVAQAPVAGAHPAPAAPRAPAPAATSHAAAPTAPARPMAPAATHATAPAHKAPPVTPAPAPAPVASQAAAPAPVQPPAPATPAPAPAPAAPAATGGFPSAAKMAAAAGRKPRILIVDDSEMTARIIEADLVTKGFEVHIADSADKATKIILKKQTRPDLVLLDVRMPNVNGEQFCRFIKSNSLFKGIKVLLCSGENIEELQRICREAGADGYVPKDAVLGHLVAKELDAPAKE
jgi:CheY-like chemotaxis protein